MVPEVLGIQDKEINVFFRASLVAQMVKNLPAMQETPGPIPWSPSLTQKGMATHYSILAWRIPWTEEPGELQSMGSQKSQTRLSN